REVPGAERFDACLQTLQPRGQPAHNRIGTNADGECEQRDHEKQRETGMPVAARHTRDQPPAVGEMERTRRRTPAAQPAAAVAARGRRWQWLADGRVVSKRLLFVEIDSKG